MTGVGYHVVSVHSLQLLASLIGGLALPLGKAPDGPIALCCYQLLGTTLTYLD